MLAKKALAAAQEVDVLLINDKPYIYCKDVAQLIGTSEIYIRRAVCDEELVGWQGIKHPEDRRKLYISYPDLMEKHRQKIFVAIGCPIAYAMQVMRSKKLDVVLKWVLGLRADSKDIAFFKGVLGAGGGGAYTDVEVVNMATMCSLFRVLLGNSLLFCEMGFAKKVDFYDAVLEVVDKKLCWSCCKVNSVAYFEKLFVKFRKQGAACLVHNNMCNKNAAKLSDEMKRELRNLYKDHKRYTMPQILNKFRAKCIEKGWNGGVEVSVSAIYNYLKTPSIQALCGLDRWDSDVWHNKFDSVIKRDGASMPHHLWVMDGTPVELWCINEAGAIVRVYAFFVIDACSSCIIGYSFGTSETERLVFEALHNAYQFTGVLPLQLQYDNASAIKALDMMDWFATLVKYSTATTVGNAKAKVIEGLFAQFNRDVLKPYFDNFSGSNITSKTEDSKAHRGWLRKNKDKLPTLNQCKLDILTAIEKWDFMPVQSRGASKRHLKLEFAHLSRYEYMLRCPNKARVLSADELRGIFWMWQFCKKGVKQKYCYGNNGICFKKNKIEYTYKVYTETGATDYDFWEKWNGKNFLVKYNYNELERIALYTPDEKFVCYADSVRRGKMAIADYEAGDGDWIQNEVLARKTFEAGLRAKLNADNSAALNEAEGCIKLDLPSKKNGAMVYKDTRNDAEERIKNGLVFGNENEINSIYRRSGDMLVVIND